MKSLNKTVAVLAAACCLLLFAVKTRHTVIPGDLRDAPNSGGAIEQSGLKRASGAVPAPAPAEGTSVPYIRAELNLQPFLGATPEETRRNMEKFLSGLNLRLVSYQDNEARGTAYIYPDKPAGLLDRARSYFIGGKLRALPNVESANEMESRNGSYWLVLFKKNMYRPQAEKMFSALDFSYQLAFPGEAKGIMKNSVWIGIAVGGIKDPKGYARQLMERFPDKVQTAGVFQDQTVLSIVSHQK